MLRSMYSGVSGLGAHQEKMDVIGNNISNVNTVGFKGSRVTFQEMLSQTMSGSVAPADGRGGLNPMQIGLGVSTSSIDNNMQTGNLQATGRDSDVAIQGDGFFVVNDGSQNVYTRAGNFAFDSEGYLVNTSTGYRVQGWLADDGEITSDSVQNLEDITLDRSMDPEESTRVSFDGNLDAGKANSFDIDSRFRVEEGGETDALSVEYEPVGGTYNRWQFTLDAENSTFDSTGDNEFTGYIELDKDGNITALENENGDDISEGSDDDPVLNINDSGETVTLETLAEGDNINDNPLFVSNGTNSEEVEANYELMARRTISTDVFDSQGNKHTVTLNAEKTDYNTWVIEEDEVEVEGSLEPADGWFGNEEEYTLHFGESGNLLDAGNTDFSLNYEPEGEMGEHELELVFDEVTQFSGDMTANFKNVDGYAAGELQSFSFDDRGNISGTYDNGQNEILARIAMARFSNPEGLRKEEGVFMESDNSGDALVGGAGTGGRGNLSPSTLEMSNVDLSDQFTEMITSQRGFQANSKAITTSDEILQEVVNLKR